MIHYWPQITMAAMMLLGMGVTLARFGERKRDHYDFVDLIVGPALMVALLHFGGFW